MTKLTERQLIERVQDSLQQAERDLKAIQIINGEAKRERVANDVKRLYHRLHLLHCDASEVLMDNWPEYSAEIITRGGGGGR